MPAFSKYMINLFILMVAFIVTPAALSAGAETRLENLQGGQQSLAQYLGKGKWVLFNIWGPSCPPCLEEVHELVSFHEDHQDKDAVVVSMALDFPSFEYARKDEVAKFVEDYFVNFTVLLGDASLAEQATGEKLLGTPSTYIYDPQGKLVAVRVGTITQEMVESYMTKYGR